MEKTLQVYIVDDSNDMGNLLKHSLKDREDTQVLFFNNANNLLAHLEMEPFKGTKWFFIDIRMPGISGVELLKLLRQRDSSYRPCILSNCNDQNIIDEAFHEGAIDYILKGRCKDELVNRINYLLDNNIKYTPEYVEVYEVREVLHTYKIKDKTKERVILETNDEVPIHSLINIPNGEGNHIYRVEKCDLADYGAILTCDLIKNCA